MVDPGGAERVVVRLLGSGDAFGSGGHFQTCILVEWSAVRVLVDCGASSSIERRFPVEFVELADRRRTVVGAATVTPYAVVHPSGAPAFAVRVELGGRTLAYSGDTEWTDTLLEAAAGADLFVCEAYAFERRIRYHLDYRTLAEHRSRLGCRRLVLTHLGEDMLRHLGEVDPQVGRGRRGRPRARRLTRPPAHRRTAHARRPSPG